MSNHDDVPVPVPLAAAAAAGRVGFFDFLSNPRSRTTFCYTAWGIAGIIATATAPSLSVNPDHIALYFLLLVAGLVLYLLSKGAGVALHLLSMAAADADLPWMEAHRTSITCYTAWGVAGIISTTTTPSLSVNPELTILYFCILLAGVTLHLLSMPGVMPHLLSMAAADLQGLAACLEGILAKMIGLDF